MPLFGQVWLYSLVAFVVGIMLTWAIWVRPLAKQLVVAKATAASAPIRTKIRTPAPVPQPVAPQPQPQAEVAFSPEPDPYEQSSFEQFNDHGPSVTAEHGPSFGVGTAIAGAAVVGVGAAAATELFDEHEAEVPQNFQSAWENAQPFTLEPQHEEDEEAFVLSNADENEEYSPLLPPQSDEDVYGNDADVEQEPEAFSVSNSAMTAVMAPAVLTPEGSYPEDVPVAPYEGDLLGHDNIGYDAGEFESNEFETSLFDVDPSRAYPTQEEYVASEFTDESTPEHTTVLDRIVDEPADGGQYFAFLDSQEPTPQSTGQIDFFAPAADEPAEQPQFEQAQFDPFGSFEPQEPQYQDDSAGGFSLFAPAADPAPASGGHSLFDPAPYEAEPYQASAAEPVESYDVPDGPFGPGSAHPLADGQSPSPDFTIKARTSSRVFHTESSPFYGRLLPQVWFRTPEDAENAGFTSWERPQ
jgi:hypothetical protein